MAKLKVGIFGLWRGAAYIGLFQKMEEVEVTALCDQDEQRLKEAAKGCGPDVKCYREFDQMLDGGIDAVVLCNYFHQHASYAIRAMERGVDVLSECTAAATLSDCVKLCEAVERTGRRYMLGENYPFTAPLREFARLCRGGTLGKILYAEGEYNHTDTREGLQHLTPGEHHWRAWLPRTYYLTHSLGPLMHATGQMPVQVSAFAVHSDLLQSYDDFRHNYDALAMMNCLTDGGALFRFSGCTAMASHSGYRVVGENGCCETGRAVGGQVHLTYQCWAIPEGKCESQTYAPNLPDAGKNAGHGGGDYWVAHHFVRHLLDGEMPFFDVYRGCAMSAAGILGWRSCLENGKTYAIPDFRDPAQRAACAGDDLTPFPDEEGRVTLPCATGARFAG